MTVPDTSRPSGKAVAGTLSERPAWTRSLALRAGL